MAKLLVLQSFDVSSFSVVMSRPSVEVFLSCSTEKIRRGNILCCTSANFRYRKSWRIRGGIRDKRRRRKLRVSFKNVFSHVTVKLRRGTDNVLCCRKFLLAEKFIDKTGEGGVSIKIFPWKIYCLILPKIFVRKSFTVSQASGIEKNDDKMGYVRIFCRLFFCLAVPKNFIGETLLRFTKLVVSKKFVDMWGWSDYHNFLSNFFCLTAPKNFMKKPSTVALVLGIKTFYDKLGYVLIFRRFFLSRSTEKLRRGNPSPFYKTSCVEETCGHVGMEQVSQFSLKLFLSHRSEKFHKETVYCRTSFGYRKFLW